VYWILSLMVGYPSHGDWLEKVGRCWREPAGV